MELICSVVVHPYPPPPPAKAHQQSRKADRLVSAGKYEEAISCHAKAADLLTEAMKTTECEQARLSLELQRDSHIKQQRLIQERWKREVRREATKARQGPAAPPAAGGQQPPPPGATAPPPGEREYDTLLYQLQTRRAGGGRPPAQPCPGSKTTKDDKTRLEEQQTTIEDLRRLVDHLLNENQRLAAENELLRRDNLRLRSEAADLVERSELWVLPQGKEIAIPQLPPLEMPAQEDLCLDDLPPLELPQDIQEELDRDKP
uniref:Nuclear receptor binding factor 2b n=1 Tax=Salarias fasciatus TaxID=181472 RepID=A0A672GUS0_SALFA